jgi:hypothetical protein
VTFWMTYEQALRYAVHEAAVTGRRYAIYKSRAVVGWWNVVQLPQLLGGQIKARAASKPQP